MSLIKRFLILLFLVPSFFCFGETRVLKKEDIGPTLEQMMLYHVENQVMTPEIVKRSFKVFVEQFDPEKIYFIQSEVEGLVNMSDAEASKVLVRLQKGDWRDFENGLKLMKSAISRAQAIRTKQMSELKKGGFVLSGPELALETQAYPVNKAHLIKKIEAQVKGWLGSEMKTNLFSTYTMEEKEKAIHIYEKRVFRHEAPYLNQNLKGEALDKKIYDHFFSTAVLKAFAKSLDSHTAFFSPEEALSMRTSLQKQFRGIGVVLKEGGRGVYIADLIKGGPAHRSQLIQKGDVISGINGMKVSQISFEDLLDKLQGPLGSSITLTLERKKDNQTQTFDVTLTRQKIVMDDERLTYRYEPVAQGIIGIVAFDGFYDNGEGITADRDLKNAIKELQSIGELKGLIIDLRQNPGGFLSQAVKVAGLFIPRGVIAIAKYSTGEIQYSRDIGGRLFYEGPCVVMTSKASASAAEVVAQALQDYGVALVVGDERTYGKGSMQYQNITDENAPAYFKVTVGRYYTASGRSTQIDGVVADVVVPSYYAPYPIGERFLRFPITRDDLGFSLIDPENPLRKIPGLDANLFSSYFMQQQMKWKKMVPRLKQNSQQRIMRNAPYSDFIHQSTTYEEGKTSRLKPWSEDFQLQESLNIVKDMILMNEN
jgi:carboxyl-terminal processing protease